jgi:hypothetical protein
MTERCEWCNHKAPDHDPLCCQYAKPIPSHEEAQHSAAYGRGPIMETLRADGDVCGTFSPREACDACGTAHLFGACPTNYVKPGRPYVVETAIVHHLPVDPGARKAVPLASGCLDYFPDALAAVAATSLAGSRQHHPDAPLHWDRSKSGDEADALLRHLVQRGTIDTDGVLHSAKVAWRALALLQKEIEAMRGETGQAA